MVRIADSPIRRRRAERKQGTQSATYEFNRWARAGTRLTCKDASPPDGTSYTAATDFPSGLPVELRKRAASRPDLNAVAGARCVRLTLSGTSPTDPADHLSARSRLERASDVR